MVELFVFVSFISIQQAFLFQTNLFLDALHTKKTQKTLQLNSLLALFKERIWFKTELQQY